MKKLKVKDEAEQSASSEGKVVKKEKKNDGKKRYILFLGNLPREAGKSDVLRFFGKVGKEVKDVRLLTDKHTSVSRGCAFVEFASSMALTKGLTFHQQTLDGKKIRVEMTVGGGSNGENRRNKLAAKKDRVERQRKKSFSRKKLQKKAKSADEPAKE
eukprot:GHVU01090298.1.p1 GENE.GHVU01090298.1~~GHVU01090298.1.p1  ORF type:complete len:157 (+),score=46.55 GHVU01090298.1:97-567(+)